MEFTMQGITFRHTAESVWVGLVSATNEQGGTCFFDVSEYVYDEEITDVAVFKAALGFLDALAREQKAAAPAKCWCGSPAVEWSPDGYCQPHHWSARVAFGGR